LQPRISKDLQKIRTKIITDRSICAYKRSKEQISILLFAIHGGSKSPRGKSEGSLKCGWTLVYSRFMASRRWERPAHFG